MNRKERRIAEAQGKSQAQLKPAMADMLSKAIEKHRAGNFKEARALYNTLLAANPENADILYLLGTLEFQQGNLTQSLGFLDKAITYRPNYADAYNNRGNVFNQLKQHDKALASFTKAIALKPGDVGAYNNRGMALYELARYDEALESYDKAIALNPSYALAYHNRGKILSHLRRYDEAIESFDKAVALNPNYPETHNSRGAALLEINRYSDAMICFAKAIALAPGFAEAYYNMALAELTLGHYEEGWRLYEKRWEGPVKHELRIYWQPLWLGKESLEGKTIFLYPEQGLGDVIQLCRYVPLVEARGAKVILGVPSTLYGLFNSLKVKARIITEKEPLPPFDLRCPLFSLPLALETTTDTIPANVPYLFADAQKQKFWQECLGEKTRPRIGLVWSGGTKHTNDHNRSIPLSLLAPLLEGDYDFHSLQKEYKAEDAAFLAQHTQIISHADGLRDFSDTAALVAEMDLIISVDTSVAHLAGAMAKPLWILLPFRPDFRWLLEREDSPWYPTARLFRQQKPDDWDSVIARVKTALESL